MARPSREEVAAWLRENPEAGGAAIHRRWPDLPESTAKYWVRLHKKGELLKSAEQKGQTGKPRARGKGGTPAKDLGAEDRDRAVSIVRNAHGTVAAMMAKIRRAVEQSSGDEVPTLDGRTAQALLNLARTGQVLIDSHPGLLALTQAEDGSSDAVDPDDLAKAFGL